MPKAGYAAKGLMMEMESLTTIRYSGKYNNKLVEITKTARNTYSIQGGARKHAISPGI
ncbi:hypothetical protein MASR1M12_10360 [Erysipelotrichia bacterium]